MPIVGDVNQLHKIIAIAYDSQAQRVEITMKAEGQYEYDPIYFQGSVDGALTLTVPQPMVVPISMAAPTIG
jgi:YD repeat-containing protein